MQSTPGACELSVLVATRDRAVSLERMLSSLAAADTTGLDWEVLIVDNGSRDATPAVLAGSIYLIGPLRASLLAGGFEPA